MNPWSFLIIILVYCEFEHMKWNTKFSEEKLIINIDGYLYVNEKCERSVISGESPGIIHFAVKVIFNTPPINFAI